MNATYWFLGGCALIIAGQAMLSIPDALRLGGGIGVFIGLFLAIGRAKASDK